MSDGLPDRVGVLIGITQPNESRPLSGWLKDPRSITYSGAELVPRPAHQSLAVEAEVALVIGTATTGVFGADLAACVRGWTIANDVTDFKQAALDPRTFQAKNGRCYTPIGPKLQPGLPQQEELVTLLIDGNETSSAAVGSLPISPLETLMFVAQWIDLEPDDVILTGALTPSMPIAPGQSVRISNRSCGKLINTVSLSRGALQATRRRWSAGG